MLLVPGEVTLGLLHIDVARLCIMVANSTNMIKLSHKAVLEDLSKWIVWNFDGIVYVCVDDEQGKGSIVYVFSS